MQERGFRSVFLKKDLVLDVCEPYTEKVQVKFNDHYFNMFKFGTFEYNDEQYAFGAEEHEYLQHFGNAPKSAKRGRGRKTATTSKCNKKPEATNSPAQIQSLPTRIPIVFVKVKSTRRGNTKYELAPAHNFLYRELEAIEEIISYSLESQRVSMHYGTRCCG